MNLNLLHKIIHVHMHIQEKRTYLAFHWALVINSASWGIAALVSNYIQKIYFCQSKI